MIGSKCETIALLCFMWLADPDFALPQVLSHQSIFQKDRCAISSNHLPICRDSSHQASAIFKQRSGYGWWHGHGSVTLPLLSPATYPRRLKLPSSVSAASVCSAGASSLHIHHPKHLKSTLH